MPFVSGANPASLGATGLSCVTGAFSRITPKLGPACITGSVLDANSEDGMNLVPSVFNIVNQRPPQGELGTHRQCGKMPGVAGHQLNHHVPVSLLLIGEQVPILRVGGELVVYISVVRNIRRYIRSVYCAGYGLAGIEHQEAIGVPYPFQRPAWRRA